MRAPLVSRSTLFGALLVLAGCDKGTDASAAPATLVARGRWRPGPDGSKG
jgi:hypothetical protein